MNDEILIEHIRNYPCIYDKGNADFKDREKKRRAWMEVAKNVGVDETIALKRWTNLRERYTKEVRNAGNTSGSGASQKRQWPLLENLSFLRSQVVPRPMRKSAPLFHSEISILSDPPSPNTLSPVCTESAALTTSQSAQPGPSTSSQCDESATSTSRSRKRRTAQEEDLDAIILETMKTFKEVCARRASREEFCAEVETFGRWMCSIITKLSPATQAKVMRRCSDYVLQAQYDELQEDKES